MAPRGFVPVGACLLLTPLLLGHAVAEGPATTPADDWVEATEAAASPLAEEWERVQHLDMMAAQLQVLFAKFEAELDHTQSMLVMANDRFSLQLMGKETLESKRLYFEQEAPAVFKGGQSLMSNLGEALQKVLISVVDDLTIVGRRDLVEAMKPLLKRTMEEAGDLKSWLSEENLSGIGAQSDRVVQHRLRMLQTSAKVVMRPANAISRDLFKVFRNVAKGFEHGNARLVEAVNKLSQDVTVVAWKFYRFAGEYQKIIVEAVDVLNSAA